MKVEFAAGSNRYSFAAPDDLRVTTLDVAPTAPLTNVSTAMRAALADPVGMDGPLTGAFGPRDSVCIVVSDSFRRTGVHLLLPTLLDDLAARGIDDEGISFLVATGVHRGPTEDELDAILGAEVADRFRSRVFVHDAYDVAGVVEVGRTSRGTVVEVNRRLVEADHVIATGAVVLHYFGGFGGGRKSIVPGLASAKTIAQNHGLNLHPTEDRLDEAVRIGVCAGNPVAEDMLEAAELVAVDGIVNTVLNRDGAIARIFAGHFTAAHDEACAFARELYAVPLDGPADIVVAASPDSRNFVQTHKALYNAALACKADGRIVLVAPCVEGLGGETFTKWLDLETRGAIIRELRRVGEINGQTALSTLEKTPRTIMVTDLSDGDVERLGARREATLQGAVDVAMADLSAAPMSLIVMPSAAYSVPMLASIF